MDVQDGRPVPTDEWRITQHGLDMIIEALEKDPSYLDEYVVPLGRIDGERIDDDQWEPLPIDRSTPTYEKMIVASEAAIREVEKNNGYAASAPEERAGVLSAMKGTLQAIKEGFPSRSLIISGLLKPLKFLAEKFSTLSMGEFAKRAIEALVNWLT